MRSDVFYSCFTQFSLGGLLTTDSTVDLWNSQRSSVDGLGKSPGLTPSPHICRYYLPSSNLYLYSVWKPWVERPMCWADHLSIASVVRSPCCCSHTFCLLTWSGHWGFLKDPYIIWNSPVWRLRKRSHQQKENLAPKFGPDLPLPCSHWLCGLRWVI